jgi:hypothetical protein
VRERAAVSSLLLQLDVADACANSCDLADRKLALIDQKIAELTAIRRALAKLMAQCDKKLRRGACPSLRLSSGNLGRAHHRIKHVWRDLRRVMRKVEETLRDQYQLIPLK